MNTSSTKKYPKFKRKNWKTSMTCGDRPHFYLMLLRTEPIYYIVTAQRYSHLGNINWLSKHGKLAIPAEFVDDIPEK